jgi:HNH endonuclease
MDRKLKQAVRERARGLCEYCQLPEGSVEELFVADHIIAEHHEGPTELENLAFACGRCNRHKGPNLTGVDPESRQIIPLFNPRTDTWATHFARAEARLIGLTPTGRVTVHVLALNEPRIAERRLLLIRQGLFPPRDL